MQPLTTTVWTKIALMINVHLVTTIQLLGKIITAALVFKMLSYSMDHSEIVNARKGFT